jgi:hypothetical protein
MLVIQCPKNGEAEKDWKKSNDRFGIFDFICRIIRKSVIQPIFVNFSIENSTFDCDKKDLGKFEDDIVSSRDDTICWSSNDEDDQRDAHEDRRKSKGEPIANISTKKRSQEGGDGTSQVDAEIEKCEE